MIGMLTFLNPPTRKGARVRVRRRGRKTAREGKEKVMARTRVRRRGRRVRRSVPVIRRRRRRVTKVRVSRRRRRRAARKNPLFRSRRSGKFKGRGPGRRLHRRRRSPHYWHNPPIRRRRRRHARRNPVVRRRRSSRRYRRNPGTVALRRRVSLSDPIGSVMAVFKEAFSKETLMAAVQSGIGFGGTLGGSKLIFNSFAMLNTPIGRVGTNFVVTVLETLLFGAVGGAKLGARVLTGGLLATIWQGVSEAVRGTPAAQWVPTLGEGPEDAEFRRAIEGEVLRELRGGRRAGPDGMSIYLKPAGINYVPAAGTNAYLTGREADKLAVGGVNAYMTERELDRATGMGDSEGEFGSASAPERF